MSIRADLGGRNIPMKRNRPERGSIHVGCSAKARNPNRVINTERVKNDKMWTCEGAETAFIALFVVGVKYVNEAAKSGITTRDDRGIDGVSVFSS